MAIEEMIIQHPIYSLMIISAIITLVSTLVQKWTTDQKQLNILKKRQKELQKELRKCKDETRLKEFNMEMMQIASTMMKSSFKPMLITIIPFLILFNWLSKIYGGANPLLGGWIWYYIGFSIVASLLFRKIFKVA